jgi:hypothetical protein
MADYDPDAELASVPADQAAVVTPNDDADLDVTCRALLIGTAGDLRVTTRGGTTLTLPNVPVGLLPLRVKRVFATSTTADDITALW